MQDFVYDDGGRAAAGYKGSAGDCVVRAVAIAAQLPYDEVYKRLAAVNAGYRGRSRKAKAMGNSKSARNGVWTQAAAFKAFMAELGFVWVATMKIGSGCKVHLTAEELPRGRLVINVSRHSVAMIDGVIHDTYDPRRNTLITENGVTRIAGRCVYGYWKLAA